MRGLLRHPRWSAALGTLGALLACAALALDSAYDWKLPAWAPRPLVPAGNPMTPAKVELGRWLFYDTRLSVNGSTSCATCHQQARAFTDGARVAKGATGELHPRNSMSLANAAYNPTLTWANPHEFALESQARTPMFGTTPIEMGLAGREEQIRRLLARDPRYARLFRAAFPKEADPYTLDNLTRALAAFERTLVSFDSPYDRYRYGEQADAIPPSAKRGEKLFFSERMQCFHCHGGINFTDSVSHQRLDKPEISFHNTGLYNLDGRGAYPAGNTGMMEFTRDARDMGRFRAPTLRNVAVTAPYMHDGSIATLEEVIAHYAAGGKGNNPASNVLRNPLQSEFVAGFSITPEETRDLVAFLESLTDRGFLTNPAHADPRNLPAKKAAP
jgi:cytochrome c peroxidase